MDSATEFSGTPAADSLSSLGSLRVYPRSVVQLERGLLFLAQTARQRCIGYLTDRDASSTLDLTGEVTERGDRSLLLSPLNAQNAEALRKAVPWLQPRPLGLGTSAGLGDRLGVATPGHVRAVAAAKKRSDGRDLSPIFAQQSMREMARTGRTPQLVMDDATFGVFQEGWQQAIGADADHLKTPSDIDKCAGAGFTFFTIDPGEYVDSAADHDGEQAVAERYESLPWSALENTPEGLRRSYVGRRFELDDRWITLDEGAFMRAAVKYGRAVAHVARMYRHLTTLRPMAAFELEVSVDETETPTSHPEHVFIANELRRLGVRWVSLAPRYVGRFEKGVDYIGDLAVFEKDFAGHAAIARAFGPYKLSLHSGSDKFSIYGIAAYHARGLVHLKTAGTSYVEALRAVAQFDPLLFRDIYAFAVSRYENDRASYHVSAELARVPSLGAMSDTDLPAVLDQFDARQVLHVTFGSVLQLSPMLGERLMAGIVAHNETYHAILERHFMRHLEPLLQTAG